MPTIELKVVPRRTEVLSGESLPVQVVLTNTGSAPVEVRATDEQSAFTYYLRRPTEDDPFYALSVTAWLTASWGNPPAVMELMTETAAPGASLEYEEDLAVYVTGPIAPGPYQLSVLYEHETGHYRSPEVPIRIALPSIPRDLLATAAGPTEGRLGLAFVHENEDGSASLFQRESEPGSPASGVLYRRISLPSPAKADGVACATELDENRGIRWFATLTDGAVTASLAQEDSLFGTIGSKPLELADARLSPHGWQLTEEDAIFLAIGRNAKGGMEVVSATFEAGKEGTLLRASFGAKSVPEHWAAQYVPGSDPAQFTLVWAEPGADGVRILAQSVQPGKSGGAPKPLVETVEDLVVLGLDPVSHGEAGTLDALFGPVGEKPEMIYRRMPLAGEGAAKEWRFDVPVAESKALPTAWRIPHAVLPGPVALARLADELIVIDVTKEREHRVVAGPAPDIDHLRLELVGGVLWAIWTDKEVGLAIQAVATLD